MENTPSEPSSSDAPASPYRSVRVPGVRQALWTLANATWVTISDIVIAGVEGMIDCLDAVVRVRGPSIAHRGPWTVRAEGRPNVADFLAAFTDGDLRTALGGVH